MDFKFKVVLTPITDPGFEGYYIANVPSLPVVVTQGKNKEEALQMAHDAVSLHLEGMLEENEIIPLDFVETIELNIKLDK